MRTAPKSRQLSPAIFPRGRFASIDSAAAITRLAKPASSVISTDMSAVVSRWPPGTGFRRSLPIGMFMALLEPDCDETFTTAVQPDPSSCGCSKPGESVESGPPTEPMTELSGAIVAPAGLTNRNTEALGVR